MVRARKPELKGLPHFNTKRGQTSSARTNQPLPPVPEAEESGNDRQTTEPKKGGIDHGLGACQTEAKGCDNTTHQTEPKDDDHDMVGQTNKTRSPRSRSPGSQSQTYTPTLTPTSDAYGLR